MTGSLDSAKKEAAILGMLRAGLRPIPNWWPLPDGRCACANRSCDSSGKHPCIPWQVYQRRAPTELEVRSWIKKYPGCNCGLVLGEGPGVIAVDLDGPKAEELLLEHGIELPESATVLSHRGAKVLLRHPGGVFPKKIALLKNDSSAIDLLGDGCQVCVPPSSHYRGGNYKWIIPPSEGIADPPPALLELVRAAARDNGANPIHNEKAPGDRIPHGERNIRLTSLAGGMRRHGMSQAAIGAALLEENIQRCDPPLAEPEVRKIAASVGRYEPAPEPSGASATVEHLTDLGNAKRLVTLHGGDLRYCHPARQWLWWNGRHWEVDKTGETKRLAKATVLNIYDEAARAVEEEVRKALAKHAAKSEGDQRLRAMLALAESESGIPILPEQMDRDPWLLNCRNGTLDLRTGDLKPHNRGDFITKIIPAIYDPAAICPAWDAFLQHIMADNPNLIGFLQRAVGSALTGHAGDQVLFILYGIGANGKTTWLKVVGILLGDYAVWTPAETFMVKHGEGIPNDVARLRGARFVAATEIEEGKRLAEGLVKRMTGGDRLVARFLHQEFFEFDPTGKVFLAVNHRPIIKGTDHAIWRRIRLVPFTVRIPEEEQDLNLSEKLATELPGILNWALAGCRKWQDHGLGTPDEVRTVTKTYRADMDVIGEFLEECCEIGEGLEVGASDLYARYIHWSEANREKPGSQRWFGETLAELGYECTRDSTSRRKMRMGLRPKPLESP